MPPVSSIRPSFRLHSQNTSALSRTGSLHITMGKDVSSISFGFHSLGGGKIVCDKIGSTDPRVSLTWTCRVTKSGFNSRFLSVAPPSSQIASELQVDVGVLPW